MNPLKFKNTLTKFISNIPGWSTQRKIIIIESDDWGSVYMPDLETFNKLTSIGFDFSGNHYLHNDCLESNEDLEMLFETLSKHKDATGRSPIITGACVIANPDFDKIEATHFTTYEYELYTEVCKRNNARNKVINLWKEGISKRLIIPAFHGREHLNVQRWMRLLQNNNISIKTIFKYKMPCISKGKSGETLPNLRAAFDIDDISDLEYMKSVISSGLDSFKEIYGFKTDYFIPPNGPFNNSLESTLYQCGIKYIGTAKINREPLGHGKYQKQFRYIGKRNKLGQVYITRNCFFEPCSWEHPATKDWLSDCMKEIDIAFTCRKPAIISSHRVNYTGYLNPNNRSNGLRKLDSLLTAIMKKWPDAEFMSTSELGSIVTSSSISL